MVMEDEVDRHAMVAADKSRIIGIIDMLTTVPNPPQARGDKAAPETGKGRLSRNAGIMVGKVPKFNGQKTQVCEAYQLGKQHRLPFPNE